MSEVISTHRISKVFGRIVAVNEVSLTVRRGEIYAFLGLNGAGKTTTIRMILGMIKRTSGEASLLGHPIGSEPHDIWSKVGYLVDSPHPYPELSTRENLEIARRLSGIGNPRTVDDIIDRLSLSPCADQRAGTLSQGNIQRLGLARALIHNPEVLILDEPSNGLDPAGVVEVREMLRHMATQLGVTIFMSSHILSEVARLATRIGVIHEGKLLEELDTETLARHERRRVVLDARDRGSAVRILEEAGYAIRPAGDGSLEIDGDEAAERTDSIAKLLVDFGTPPTKLIVEQDDLESHFLRLISQNRRERE